MTSPQAQECISTPHLAIMPGADEHASEHPRSRQAVFKVLIDSQWALQSKMPSAPAMGASGQLAIPCTSALITKCLQYHATGRQCLEKDAVRLSWLCVTADIGPCHAGRLGRVQLLAMVGSSAALICAVQAAVLEHRDCGRISFIS